MRNWSDRLRRGDIADEYSMAHRAQILRERTNRKSIIRLYYEETWIQEGNYFCRQYNLREEACSGLREAAGADSNSCWPGAAPKTMLRLSCFLSRSRIFPHPIYLLLPC